MKVPRKGNSRSNDLSLIAPFLKERAEIALTNAQNDGYPIAIFEAYRSPERQDYLYAQGRTRPGKIVTNATAYHSTHQFGLAIDVAFYRDKVWSWDGAFDKVAKYFEDEGFHWLHPYEQVHFEITSGVTINQMQHISEEFGLESLWELVQSRIT